MKGANEDGICCSTWSIWKEIASGDSATFHDFAVSLTNRTNMWKEGTASGRGSWFSSVTVQSYWSYCQNEACCQACCWKSDEKYWKVLHRFGVALIYIFIHYPCAKASILGTLQTDDLRLAGDGTRPWSASETDTKVLVRSRIFISHVPFQIAWYAYDIWIICLRYSILVIQSMPVCNSMSTDKEMSRCEIDPAKFE